MLICLIIPNPDITNPEVVENLLYVGTNQHVHDDDNDGDDGCDEEEVGANLHHEQEVGANNNDERWAWMQTEVQNNKHRATKERC